MVKYIIIKIGSFQNGHSMAVWLISYSFLFIISYFISYIKTPLETNGVFLSGWRDSNSRSSGPKPDALDQLGHTPYKNQTSQITTKANFFYFIFCAPGQNRTDDTRIFSPLLYHWATEALGFSKILIVLLLKLVAGVGLEPTTSRLWAWRAANCSIPLYLCGRWRIRTSDLNIISVAL